MTALLRAVAALGGLLLAISFFVPLGFHNSPYGRVVWAVEDISLSEGAGGVLLSVGMAVVIAYSYAWAAIAAAAVWFTEGGGHRAAIGSQVGCQAAGGVVLVVFGALLLLRGDAFVPLAAQVAAVVVPPVLVGAMLVIALRVRPQRRVAAVAVLGFFPHVVLQPVLALFVWMDGYRPWGFVLGSAGALLGMAGSVCLFIIGGIRDGDVPGHSHVQ